VRTAFLICFSCALAATAAAQDAVPAVATTPPPAVQDNYSYQPEGRRDPFVSLLGAGTDPRPARRAEGPAGLAVGEISVRGVMQSHDRLVAMIQGPDNRTYVVHQGDQLSDGIVKSVTPQGLVVVQNVSDPLSTQKQREVRKLLRSLEEAKE
jgi:Tfp pilus assembly protein PilP